MAPTVATSSVAHFWEIVYHFGPPLMVALVMLYLTRTFKANDDKKVRMDMETLKYKRRLENILVAIQQQNAWIIRKFIELGSAHNLSHPDLRVDWSDYPEMFPIKEGWTQTREGE